MGSRFFLGMGVVLWASFGGSARAADCTFLGPVLRDADGSVSRLSQPAAEARCANAGGLPTLLQLASALNPSGVSLAEKPGFDPVYGPGGIAFYYDADTYRRPSGDEGANYFWSSSVDPFHADFAGVVDGITGRVFSLNRADVDFNGAARCVFEPGDAF